MASINLWRWLFERRLEEREGDAARQHGKLGLLPTGSGVMCVVGLSGEAVASATIFDRQNLLALPAL
jgi:hypothetical protein